MWADIRWQRPDFPKFPKLATICLSIPVTRVLTKLGLKPAQRCYSKCSVSGLQNQTLQNNADCHSSCVDRLMMLSTEAPPRYPHRIVGSRPRSIITQCDKLQCRVFWFDCKWWPFPIRLSIPFLCYDIQTASGNVHGFMCGSFPPWIRF